MSIPEQPAEDPAATPAGQRPGPPDPPQNGSGSVPVSPLRSEDPPKIGDFWLDARLGHSPAGVAFTGHDEAGRPVMIILLSQGAAADAAARDRFAGAINKMHIDVVYARGGQGQDFGRLAKKFKSEDGDPVAPDDRQMAPWAALAYDGSPAALAEAARVLDDVELDTLPAQGEVAGPDYQHYWIDRTKPGLTRFWPLPWPGRYDRAGWRTILVSWLLMLLLAALAILIAILIFHNQPPESPPTPTGGSGSPPPQSASASPQSGSPSTQSGSPSGGASPARSPSGSGSPSKGSPSPSGTQSGGGGSTPAESGSPGGNTPRSKL
jgi:hypothetical protein